MTRVSLLVASLAAALASNPARAGASRVGGFVRGGGGGISPEDVALQYTSDSAIVPLTTTERTAGLYEVGFDSQFYPGQWDVGGGAQLTLGPAFGAGVRLAGAGGAPAIGATLFSGLELGVVYGNWHAMLGSHVGLGFTSVRNMGTFEQLPLDPTEEDPTRRWSNSSITQDDTEVGLLYGDMPVIPMGRVGYRVNNALFLLSVGYRLAPVRLGAAFVSTEGGGPGTPLAPEAFDVAPAFDPRGAFIELGVYGWKGGDQ